MKQKYVVWLPLLVLITVVMVGILSAAQTANRPPGKGSSVAPTKMLGYVERVNTAIRANTAATNLTDQQVGLLMNDAIKINLGAELWARSTMYNLRASHEANLASSVRLLEDLRAVRTNEAMRRLEADLEANVAGLGTFLDKIGPAMHLATRPEDLETLQMAKDYWRKFPRTTGNTKLDSSVKQALSLLDNEAP